MATNDANNMDTSGGNLTISIDLMQMCPNNCSQNGNCSSDGKCLCDENFRGEDCSSSILNVPELTELYFNTTWDLSKESLEEIAFGAIKFLITEPNSSLKYIITVRKFQINNLRFKKVSF